MVALIPVSLQFEDIGSNSIITLEITTPGAMWSLGNADFGGSGFSYSDLSSSNGNNNNSAQCCVDMVELTLSVLTIRVGQYGSVPPFSMALILEYADEVEYIEGNCMLNDGGRVLANVGGIGNAEWRTGNISAVLPKKLTNFKRVRLAISALPPGRSIAIQLNPEAPGAKMRWSFGPPGDETAKTGMVVEAGAGQPLPINSISLTADCIQIASAGGPDEPLTDVTLMLYVERLCSADESPDANDSRKDKIQMRALCDDSVSVTCQLNEIRSEGLSGAYAVFPF